MRETSLTLSRFSTSFIPISLFFQRARKLIILKVSWHRIKTIIHAYINNDSLAFSSKWRNLLVTFSLQPATSKCYSYICSKRQPTRIFNRYFSYFYYERRIRENLCLIHGKALLFCGHSYVRRFLGFLTEVKVTFTFTADASSQRKTEKSQTTFMGYCRKILDPWVSKDNCTASLADHHRRSAHRLKP